MEFRLIRITPLERKILPDEHPGPITRFMEFGGQDMRMNAQHVQVGLLCQGYITGIEVTACASAKWMLLASWLLQEKAFQRAIERLDSSNRAENRNDR